MNVPERIASIREKIDNGFYPWMLVNDAANLQHEIFTETVNLMLEVTEHSGPWEAIVAIEKKIGVDGSTDPDSLDYRLAQVEGCIRV